MTSMWTHVSQTGTPPCLRQGFCTSPEGGARVPASNRPVWEWAGAGRGAWKEVERTEYIYVGKGRGDFGRNPAIEAPTPPRRPKWICCLAICLCIVACSACVPFWRPLKSAVVFAFNTDTTTTSTLEITTTSTRPLVATTTTAPQCAQAGRDCSTLRCCNGSFYSFRCSSQGHGQVCTYHEKVESFGPSERLESGSAQASSPRNHTHSAQSLSLNSSEQWIVSRVGSENASKKWWRHSPVQTVNGSAGNSNKLLSLSLFCWAVAKLQEEIILTAVMHRRVSGIFSCEVTRVFTVDGMSIDGFKTLALGADPSTKAPWGSWYNTLFFLKAWDQIVQTRVYNLADWTVKVDPDCVFFPARLKIHLIKPPANAVYLLNSDAPKLPMLGPLEVFSKAAMVIYSQRKQECLTKMPWYNQTGEDGFFHLCMGATLGVASWKDTSVICNPCAVRDCDGITPAFHAYKDEYSFEMCYNRSNSFAEVAAVEEELDAI